MAPITLVIPVRDRAALVGRTLASVAAQTLPPQVVLVDNGSTDGTVEVLRQWAGRQRRLGLEVEVLTEPEPGACAARNRGLRSVKTDYVMFFDSDDEMAPTHIADFAAAAARHPEAEILGRAVTLGLPGGKTRRGSFAAGDAVFHHLFRATLATQRYAARTALVRRVGGWDNGVKGWNDFELGLRLLLAVEPRAVVDIGGAPTVRTHFVERSITGRDFGSRPRVWEGALEACRRDVARAGRPELAKWLDARAAILAAHYRREGRADEARRLLGQTLERSAHPLRTRLLYWHNLCFGRLTWLAARLVYPFG